MNILSHCYMNGMPIFHLDNDGNNTRTSAVQYLKHMENSVAKSSGTVTTKHVGIDHRYSKIKSKKRYVPNTSQFEKFWRNY